MIEVQVFVSILLIFVVLGVDEFLYRACIYRYMDVFGTDGLWTLPGYGFYMFWRLLDYDNRNIR